MTSFNGKPPHDALGDGGAIDDDSYQKRLAAEKAKAQQPAQEPGNAPAPQN